MNFGCSEAGGGGAGGDAPGRHPYTTPKKDTRHQYGLTRLVTPMGSADIVPACIQIYTGCFLLPDGTDFLYTNDKRVLVGAFSKNQ